METRSAHSALSTLNSHLSTSSPPRRAQPNRYPDFGPDLAPAFPIDDQWHWEFVACYSGVTVPDSHRVPRHLTAILANERFAISKSGTFMRPAWNFAKRNFWKS